MLTEKEKNYIWKACDEYKKIVSRIGSDVFFEILAKYSAEEFYNTVIGNDDGEEFKNDILIHPFFEGKGYETLCDVYDKEKSLFMYCLQQFLFSRLLIYYDNFTTLNQNDIEVNPDTTEVINKKTKDTVNTKKEYICPDCEEMENKKEFIKEVMKGVERKKSLKEFFDDLESYKQFRSDVDNCLLYMDWEKIHKIMKLLKWKWATWIDNEYNAHHNTVPSVFGIREEVFKRIREMETWIMEHPDEKTYKMSIGGFEYEMYMCNEPDLDDDYEGQVRFIVRFIAEDYDNGM